MAKRPSNKRSVEARKCIDLKNMDFVLLVDQVRKSRNKEKSDLAFNEIERRMNVKLKQISYKFHIPGFSFHDIYQESLFALRYKAIKDYDKDRGSEEGPYPFDKFAVLCIRRHLSTKLKASYQNKKKVLNLSLSLDQDRNDNSEEGLFLSDIIPKTEGTVLEDLEQNEYFKILFSTLHSRLSKFEKEVFLLYVQRYSYEQIAEYLVSNSNKKNKPTLSKAVKSVDNALSRIKNKAKEVFDQHGQD